LIKIYTDLNHSEMTLYLWRRFQNGAIQGNAD
jgi:hypothetical protein